MSKLCFTVLYSTHDIPLNPIKSSAAAECPFTFWLCMAAPTVQNNDFSDLPCSCWELCASHILLHAPLKWSKLSLVTTVVSHLFVNISCGKSFKSGLEFCNGALTPIVLGLMAGSGKPADESRDREGV